MCENGMTRVPGCAAHGLSQSFTLASPPLQHEPHQLHTEPTHSSYPVITSTHQVLAEHTQLPFGEASVPNGPIC